MLYFKEELIPKVEKQLNQFPVKNNRYFYGVSNGAGFGLSLLNQYPNLINTYICFSTFGGDIQTNIWNENIEYPNLYLQYGSQEPYLKEDADFIKSTYKKLNSFAEIKEFQGGHNNDNWSQEFTKLISKLIKVE